MDRDERIAEILGTWQERRERGDSIEPEALVAAHPELAHDLAERLAALGYLDLALADAPQPSVPVPSQIGDFRILREIGRGGMGVVYEAEQVSMSRKVALKVLSLPITGTRQAVQRFHREARASGRLHHTNVAAVYGFGQHAGHWYYAMELIEGRPLAEVLAVMKGAPPTETRLARSALGDGGSSSLVPDTRTGSRAYYLRVAEMFAGVAEALHHAHQEQVIHRDIKPSNLLLDGDGCLKLVDFGLAAVADQATLTATGEFLGTVAYMSPEQATARHEGIDHRTDIYSLGATLYEVLTLTAPFDSRNIPRLCSQIASRDPIPPRRRDRRIPRDLETICLRAMEKEPARRYRDAERMAHDLQMFAVGEAIRARRPGPATWAWRRLRRHPVATLLALLTIAGAATGLALSRSATRETALRIDLEYAALCARAEEAAAHARDGEAYGLFSQAIERAPDRPEAYLGRALVPTERLDPRSSRPTGWYREAAEDGLRDVEMARARGLSRRTYHLARAYLLASADAWQESEDEAALAGVHPIEGALDLYFEATFRQGREGSTPGAVALYTEALESCDAASTIGYLARLRRAYLRGVLGDYDGALADLHTVREMGDERPEVRVSIALLWRRLNKRQLAEREFTEALAILRREKSPPEVWCSVALTLRAELDWRERITEEALVLHPGSVELLLDRARLLHRCGAFEKAAVVCEEARRIDPENAYVHYVRGHIQASRGELERALDSYARAEPIGGGWPVNRRGWTLLKLGRYEDAAAEFGRAFDLNSGPGNFLSHQGLALALAGRHQEAREAFDAAVRRFDQGPSQCKALVFRACFAAAQGRREDALADFALAADQSFGDASAADWLCRAMARQRVGRLDEALADIDRPLRMQPGRPDFHYRRGRILLDMQEHKRALQAFERGLELKPSAEELVWGRTLALRALGQAPAGDDGAPVPEPEEGLYALSRLAAIG